MKKKKEYVGIMKIHKEISEEKLKEEMNKFIGKIMQKPPIKSRVKREEREREVYSWDLLEYDKERKEVLFDVEVEAGTYIRKLCSELGLAIGGAHMLELRRTKAGIFGEKDSINLYELEKIKENEGKLKEILIPGEIISKILPVIEVKEESVDRLLTGKPVFKDDLKLQKTEKFPLKEEEKDGDVAVFSNDKFIEIAKMVKEKNIIAKPQFVFN